MEPFHVFSGAKVQPIQLPGLAHNGKPGPSEFKLIPFAKFGLSLTGARLSLDVEFVPLTLHTRPSLTW